MSDFVTSVIPGMDFLPSASDILGNVFGPDSAATPDIDSASTPIDTSGAAPNTPIDTTGSPYGPAQTPPGVTPDPSLPNPVDLTQTTTLPSTGGLPGIPSSVTNALTNAATKAGVSAGLGALGLGTTTTPTSTTTTPTSNSTGTNTSNLNGTVGSSNGGFTNFTPGITTGSNSEVNLGGTFAAPQSYNTNVQAPQYAVGGGVSPFEFSGFHVGQNKGSSTASLHGVNPNFPSMADTAPHFADGGHIPEFYSEGGAKSNTYVTGEGDGTSDSVPAMLAKGEFVLPAHIVSDLGNGSNEAGSKVLDEFLKVIREHKQSNDSDSLPPDSKGPLGYLSIAVKKVGK